jgi:hypothetical protein
MLGKDTCKQLLLPLALLGRIQCIGEDERDGPSCSCFDMHASLAEIDLHVHVKIIGFYAHVMSSFMLLDRSIWHACTASLVAGLRAFMHLSRDSSFADATALRLATMLVS